MAEKGIGAEGAAAEDGAERTVILIATLGIVFASVSFGLVPFFARSLTEGGLAPQSVALWRFVIGFAVLGWPFLRALRGPRRGAALWSVAVGAAIGLGWTGYVSALSEMPVATAGVIYMTYPVFTLLALWAWTRQAPGRRPALGAALVLAAALVAAWPELGGGFGWRPLLLALAAPLGFGFGIVVLTEKLTALPPLARIGGAGFGGLVGLAPLIATLPREQVLPSSPGGWALLAGLSLVTALIPQLVYVISAPRIGPARTAAAGALELPTMFLVGWWAFGEALAGRHIVSGALVVAALLVTPARRTRRVAMAAPERPSPP